MLFLAILPFIVACVGQIRIASRIGLDYFVAVRQLAINRNIRIPDNEMSFGSVKRKK